MIKELSFEKENKNVLIKFLEKITDFFEYTIWYNLKTGWYNLTWFFHNIKVFWKTLWDYRDWDHQYAIDAYIVCLEQLANRIENGFEEKRSASKKVQKIHELIELLKIDIEDVITETWNSGIDKGEDHEKLYDKCQKIPIEHKKKILRILEGQDPKKFEKKYQEELEKFKKEHPEKDSKFYHGVGDNYDIWVNLFDGSGVESWWE